jgi:hypothetical protein
MDEDPGGALRPQVPVPSEPGSASRAARPGPPVRKQGVMNPVVRGGVTAKLTADRGRAAVQPARDLADAQTLVRGQGWSSAGDDGNAKDMASQSLANRPARADSGASGAGVLRIMRRDIRHYSGAASRPMLTL